MVAVERFSVDELDDDWPFEVDSQVAHLFKHPHLGLDDIADAWASDPLVLSSQAAGRLAHGCGSFRKGAGCSARTVDQRKPEQVSAHWLLCRLRPTHESLPGGPMTTSNMTPEQEHRFYSDSKNQEPQGPPVRRKAKLGAPVPVRFPEDVLEQVRRRAAADDRSVSNWIRRAVEHELSRDAS